MDQATRDDYFWLVSADAQVLLEQCHESFRAKTNVLRIAKALRKQTSATRCALILELTQIRIKARRKFPFADRMFFTRRGYEQSSSQLIAEYVARNFVHFDRVVDVCCGIGGDLMALAMRNSDGDVVGVDRDPLMCLFARHNLQCTSAKGRVTVVESRFEDFDSRQFDAMHIDPDRRIHGRTVQSNFFDPKIEDILARQRPSSIAVKMAPASPRPDQLAREAELEWIGTRRECKQQMIWLGPITSHPGCQTATTVEKDGTFQRLSMSSDEIDQTIVVAGEIGPYIFEPHPAVLAGNLADAVANPRRLARLAPGIAYLTGERPKSTALLSTFKVIKTLSLNVNKLIAELVRQDAGELEVKRRGVEKVVADQLLEKKFSGSRPLTVILSRHKNLGIALITKRIRGTE